ncbi:DNA polymerase III subunit beta [Klebsiella oxytoca]|nr:DNA polymerase III subunit beta [Klebsiella oxytoca]
MVVRRYRFLGNLLLQVTDGALSLTGTDLEMEMVARVALIQPHEAGATTRSGA